MNWLDKYLMKTDGEYLLSNKGNLFVGIDEENVRPVNHGWKDFESLANISKEEFIMRLMQL